MTREEALARAEGRDYFIPREAAAFLGCTPYWFNTRQKEAESGEKEPLPYKVIMCGSRCKIMKESFLAFVREK